MIARWPGTMLPIPGARATAHALDSIRAADLVWSPAELASLEASYLESKRKKWGRSEVFVRGDGCDVQEERRFGLWRIDRRLSRRGSSWVSCTIEDSVREKKETERESRSLVLDEGAPRT
mmetsp:Transcript_3592/g.13980  ORF Transcript_3592/g.13980 Transcript_3592/m.13980 type:complete len:120 (+) Transcript_3592:2761-3120(+)